jgi:nucleoid DNA-binding protein
MTTYTKKDLVLRLRSAHGYSVREALRAVQDVMSTLQDQIEDLELGDRLTLEHIGQLECYLRKGRLKGTFTPGVVVQNPDRPALRFKLNARRRESLHQRPLDHSPAESTGKV